MRWVFRSAPAVVAASVVCAAAGQADALAAGLPGVAQLSASVNPKGYYGFPRLRILYDGSAGPVTGNKVTATVSEDNRSVAFAAPLTVMVPVPPLLHLDQGLGCTPGVGRATCTILSREDGYYVCDVAVAGNRGADVVTVRNGHSGGNADCPNGLWSSVATGAGNDVVDVRDGKPSAVACGTGYDRVYADVGDYIYPGCEVRGFS
jgi:hypothetical protein